MSMIFKGNGLEELRLKDEEETGIEDLIVYTTSPLNRKLYPLRLQLPPNNATMHVVVIHSCYKARVSNPRPNEAFGLLNPGVRFAYNVVERIKQSTILKTIMNHGFNGLR
ncbi:hypothetical protein Syun_009346 [Stephania yunnanensis]|uniref:Uncharacterized protein n=1 Tax=Stephania yunnanensis TaxID=152371 RepID=A0AAP0KGS9_9MAGN